VDAGGWDQGGESWNRAWREAKLPAGKEYLKGAHNLRHTFAKRLRDVGVDERDIQDLLHHLPRRVTRHYSAPELRNLNAWRSWCRGRYCRRWVKWRKTATCAFYGSGTEC